LDDGFDEIDRDLFYSCSIKTNVRPPHPFGEQWHNERSMVEETWVQAGLKLEEYHSLPENQKYPKLFKWFNTEKREKTIAIHCFAGYGRDNQRSPSKEWNIELIRILIKDGYSVIRLGHPNEPTFYFNDFSECNNLFDLRNKSFIEQIQIALGCSAYIGTDSGFSLAMGAYGHPQVSLITNWNAHHTKNPLCLQPLNKNNISLFNEFKDGGCSGIEQEKVLESLKLLV
jgi:ADP-heptose:LPS heptosyltransferase